MAYKRISPQPVVEGGTGDQTFTPYAVITGGTTGTGALKNVVGVGTSGQVLTSAGAGALPAWQTLAGSSITITGDSGGPLTSGSFTFTGGTSGLTFVGAGSTETLTITTVNLPDTTSSSVGIIKWGALPVIHVYGGVLDGNFFAGRSSGNFTLTPGVSIENTGVGTSTLLRLTTGLQNTAVGYLSLNHVTTGNQNTAVGASSLTNATTGSQNIAIGDSALPNLTTGSTNIAIGTNSGSAYTSSESGNISIGNSVAGTGGESNVLRIGGVTLSYVAGVYGVTATTTTSGVVLVSSDDQFSYVATGTSGRVLTSNGATSLPSFQALPASSISITGNTGGALVGSAFTFSGGTTGLSFGGAGTTETLTFAGITANAGVVNLGTDATDNTINIGTTASAGRTLNVGNTTGTSGIVERVGTGNFSLDGVGGSTYTIGSSTTTGTITIGGASQSGAISIGQSNNTIFLNSSSNAASIRIGYNQTGGSIFLGHNMTTGTIEIGSTAAQTGTISIAPGTGAQTINIAAAGTGVKTVHIADGAVANIVTIGSTTGAASLTLNSGSAGIVATGVASVAVANKNYVTINTSTGALGSDAGPASSITITGDTGGGLTGSSFTFTGGTTGLSFGGAGSTETLTFAGITANGGTVSLATDATTSTINIGTGAGVKTSTFGSTNSTSATTVQSGSGALNVTSTNGALTINSGTGTLAISNDASATTINLGTGAAAKTVTLGSTNTTSTTTLQAGSGGVKLGAVAEGALVTSSTSVISTVTGTAGFVLTANAAGTAPSFQAVSVSSGVAQNIRLVLTNSQIKALHATPITLLSAPGAGLAYNLIEAAYTFNYGGSNVFTASASQTINLYYGSSTGTPAIAAAFIPNSTIVSSSSSVDILAHAQQGAIAIANYSNQAIVVQNPVATEISGNAANNNTITINAVYVVMTL